MGLTQKARTIIAKRWADGDSATKDLVNRKEPKAMTNCEKITASPETLAAFLAALPITVQINDIVIKSSPFTCLPSHLYRVSRQVMP